MPEKPDNLICLGVREKTTTYRRRFLKGFITYLVHVANNLALDGPQYPVSSGRSERLGNCLTGFIA